MRLFFRKTFNILKSSLTPNRPYHAQWFITRRCNYRCRSCKVWHEQEYVPELSTEEVKMGLDALRQLGVVELVLSGGNPLLREDIGEIIDYSSRFFVTTVYDNGSMALRRLDALRNADFVAVSLDTLDEQKNDYAKGVSGAWKNAMEAIETLHNENINVGVSPTISKLNLNEIIDFTRYFTDRCIPVWYCLYWHDYPLRGQLFGIGEKNDELRINDGKAISKIFEELIEMKNKRKGIFITTKTLTALKNLFLTGHRSWKCKALQSFFIIDHLGQVAGCHCYPPVASVFSLPAVWHSPKFEIVRNQICKCDKCVYLCYVFYSLHSSVLSNIEIIQDQWKNAKSILKGSKA